MRGGESDFAFVMTDARTVSCRDLNFGATLGRFAEGIFVESIFGFESVSRNTSRRATCRVVSIGPKICTGLFALSPAPVSSEETQPVNERRPLKGKIRNVRYRMITSCRFLVG